MTHEAFIQIMNPLQERYPKHFIPDTMRPLYRILGHLTIDQGHEIVGKLILRCRFAPLEQDFKEAVQELNRPRTYFKPQSERFDPIFSEEERTEIWQFIKKVAAGEVDKNAIESYTAILNDTITAYYKR